MSLFKLVISALMPLLALSTETPKGVHVDDDSSQNSIYGECVYHNQADCPA